MLFISVSLPRHIFSLSPFLAEAVLAPSVGFFDLQFRVGVAKWSQDRAHLPAEHLCLV